MQEAKRMELKYIDVMSVFRFFGGIFLLAGLIVGLFGNILKIDIMSPEAIRVFPFLEKAGPGVLAGVLFGVLYGLCAGIGFSIFALLYNFFASLLGGIKFNIKE